MNTSPVNPFRDIRLRTGLSQYELAKRIGVSKHAVLRLEQGMYDRPLPKIVNYFTEKHNVARVSLINEYETFQVATREDNGRFLGSFRFNERPVDEHPLVFLRNRVRLNPTQVAKALCLSQTVVVYFEKRFIHQHTVPEQFVMALRDCGYTEQETDYFETEYDTYRSFMVKSQGLKVIRPAVPVGEVS